jgi:hypothetical protein
MEMFSGRIPTIEGIQRTNVVLVALAASTLAIADSSAAAIGCLFGGFVVILNLYILAALGRMLLAVAGGGGGGAGGKVVGALAIPLKLGMIVVLVYVLFTRVHIDGIGFGVGVLTQLLAVIIETTRVAVRTA